MGEDGAGTGGVGGGQGRQLGTVTVPLGSPRASVSLSTQQGVRGTSPPAPRCSCHGGFG